MCGPYLKKNLNKEQCYWKAYSVDCLLQFVQIWHVTTLSLVNAVMCLKCYDSWDCLLWHSIAIFTSCNFSFKNSSSQTPVQLIPSPHDMGVTSCAVTIWKWQFWLSDRTPIPVLRAISTLQEGECYYIHSEYYQRHYCLPHSAIREVKLYFRWSHELTKSIIHYIYTHTYTHTNVAHKVVLKVAILILTGFLLQISFTVILTFSSAFFWKSRS